MNQPLWSHPKLSSLLTHELTTPADRRWLRNMAPQLSYGRHAGPARADARTAAVAIVLCWNGVEWSLPLTVRSANLTRHGGQVSLPGGLIDEGETPRDAAARELGEELGVRPPLEWLGELSPLYVFASHTRVIPCVAATAHVADWRPNPHEVERVLRLDLQTLLDSRTPAPLTIVRGGFRFSAPQWTVDGRSAWGATAVMLSELRGRLQRLTDMTG